MIILGLLQSLTEAIALVAMVLIGVAMILIAFLNLSGRYDEKERMKQIYKDHL